MSSSWSCRCSRGSRIRTPASTPSAAASSIERGPEVFALESVDSEAAGLGGDVSDLRIDASVAPREADGRVIVAARNARTGSHAWPYGEVDAGTPSAAHEVPSSPTTTGPAGVRRRCGSGSRRADRPLPVDSPPP